MCDGYDKEHWHVVHPAECREVDPALKRDLHSALATQGLSLKEWFINRARQYAPAGPNLHCPGFLLYLAALNPPCSPPKNRSPTRRKQTESMSTAQAPAKRGPKTAASSMPFETSSSASGWTASPASST